MLAVVRQRKAKVRPSRKPLIRVAVKRFVFPPQCGQCKNYKPGQVPGKGRCLLTEFEGLFDPRRGACDSACSSGFVFNGVPF